MKSKTVRVSWDARANQFVKNLGYLKPDSRAQHKFYLGRDERAAIIAAARLEQVWEAVRDEEGVWDDTTLTIARQVAAGRQMTCLTPPSDFRDGEARVHWVARYAERFGGIITVFDDTPDAYRRARKVADAARADALSRVDIEYPKVPGMASAGPSVREVLEKYLATLDRTDAWERAKARQVDTLIRLAPDVKAADLTRTACQTFASSLAAGFKVKGREHKTASPITRRKLWERFKNALQWAEDELGVTLPRGLERVAFTLPKTNEPLALNLWTVDQFATVYRTATPLVRAFLLLGVNCGYQPADIGDLEDGHLYLDGQPLPEVLEGSGLPAGDYVVMTRKKNGVPGVHRLWPETAAALQFVRARRDRIVQLTGARTARLFVSDRGRPLMEDTTRGNRSTRIANLWKNAVRTAQKADPKLPTRPPKVARKVQANELRKLPGVTDDIVSMAQRRGKVSADTLLKLYASRPWAKIVEATDRLRDVFLPALQGDKV